MKAELEQYKSELDQELKNILDYWIKYTPDSTYGGFYGQLNNENKIFPQAPKGAVLNARILWSFSAAYLLYGKDKYLQMAQRSFSYIQEYFADKEYGGVYWTVDYTGKPLDTKKQIYALAFMIYGLSEFYKCNKNEESKAMAIEFYHDIVNHSLDKTNSGYIEALTQDWEPIDDLRLSEKDANERKSMNTHLHLVESLANLYTIWPDEELKLKIREIITIFPNFIIDKNSYHLHLFFDDSWNVKSHRISYGHDIEAAWLLLEVSKIINDPSLIHQMKTIAVNMIKAVKNGIDTDGGLWNERDLGTNTFIKEKDWWPQAEAMVGFFNAWELNGDKTYLQQSLASWHFIQKYILDKKNGEWFWGIKEDGSVLEEDKVGLWKCPYHNSRACMEIIKRIDKMKE